MRRGSLAHVSESLAANRKHSTCKKSDEIKQLLSADARLRAFIHDVKQQGVRASVCRQRMGNI